MVTEQDELEAQIRQQLDGISPTRQAFDRWFLSMAAAIYSWEFRHWLLTANLVNGSIMAGAVAVPLMRSAGWDFLATPLFSAYHVLCEQRPERSYFLWGYQMALDQRMSAIYVSSLVAGLAYIPLRGRLRAISWRVFFLFSLPIAIDGFTQLFEWRISNWELRTLTGSLFGVGTVWLMYPYLDRAIGLLLRTTRNQPVVPDGPEANSASEAS
jgi:uncharacterized membrane protein